jgi:hypothetical protein
MVLLVVLEVDGRVLTVLLVMRERQVMVGEYTDIQVAAVVLAEVQIFLQVGLEVQVKLVAIQDIQEQAVLVLMV